MGEVVVGDANFEVGRRVDELADRVAAINKINPGAVGALVFKLDGVCFDLRIRLAEHPTGGPNEE